VAGENVLFFLNRCHNNYSSRNSSISSGGAGWSCFFCITADVYLSLGIMIKSYRSDRERDINTNKRKGEKNVSASV
jgi:hypothetical protein